MTPNPWTKGHSSKVPTLIYCINLFAVALFQLNIGASKTRLTKELDSGDRQPASDEQHLITHPGQASSFLELWK